MKSKSIVIVIFAMLCGNLSAQKYSPGKIVTNKGDTMECMIKAGKWDINPNKIVIKNNDKTKRYRPTEIVSFQVDNRNFFSASVRLDVSNHIDGTLDLEDSQPRFVNDTIFAELILGGKKNLYRYKSPSYKEHFLISAPGAPLESLIFKRFHVWAVVTGVSVKRVLFNEEYKNQLETHFADCSGVKNKIAITGYNVAQLSSLFTLYNNCSN